jgi:eukaryotic-like serine/threonine-protein kinase
MNCPKCGTSVPDGVRQCTACHSAITWNDPNATWTGSTATGSAKASAADDLTAAGFTRSPASVGSDVLTPPPSYATNKPSPNDQETWIAGPNAPTFAGAANAPTAIPFATGGGWAGAAAAPAKVNFGPRYRVEKLLGQGGMGAVYKAYDQDLDRTVALKLVRPELMVHPEALARFKQELLLASKISHRNILRIHDLGDAGGMKFISMAYVDGEDLHNLLIREGRLPLERMLHIMKQLCAALEAAHHEGVVHRDLKPQNIMLGPGDHVYVSDFGLAKSLGAVNSLTQSGDMLGTPRYMAPEQVEAKHVDARTDIYALGLIFYEMVTGDVPFTAETTLQLMYKRAHETPPAPKTIVRDLPDWLNNIIMKCLERAPEQRYQGTADILRDIETQNAPAVSKPVRATIPQEPVAAPASRKVWFGIGAAVLAIVLAAVAIPPVRKAITGKSPTATTQNLKRVAILPFKVPGGDSRDMVTAEGISESLYAKLFQLQGISLAAPAAVAKVKLSDPPEAIAKALGVDYLITGSLATQGDELRLTLSFSDAKGRKPWSMPFSGMRGDLFTMEDKAYTALLEPLDLKPTELENTRAILHPTENLTAYEAYLRGRNALRGQADAKAIDLAISYYERAKQEDSRFALAFTGLADAYLRRYRSTKDPKAADAAISAAEHARDLAAGQNIAEVHFVLGTVYQFTGKTQEAVAELKNAVSLAPNSDEGYRRLGDALRSVSQDDSIAAYRKAIEINPYYWANYNALGAAYSKFGNNEEALKAFQEVINLAPNNPMGWANVGSVYFNEAKWEEAIPPLRKAMDLKHWEAAANLGTVYFYLKRYPESVEMFKKALELSPGQEVLYGNLADAYRWSGDKTRAVATYDQAIKLAQKALQVNPKDAYTLSSMALYYAKQGNDALAQQFIRRARSIDAKDVAYVYNEGVIAALGNRDKEAIASLQQAFQKGYSVTEAKNDPELTRMSGMSEFQSLLKKFPEKASR